MIKKLQIVQSGFDVCTEKIESIDIPGGRMFKKFWVILLATAVIMPACNSVKEKPVQTTSRIVYLGTGCNDFVRLVDSQTNQVILDGVQVFGGFDTDKFGKYARYEVAWGDGITGTYNDSPFSSSGYASISHVFNNYSYLNLSYQIVFRKYYKNFSSDPEPSSPFKTIYCSVTSYGEGTKTLGVGLSVPTSVKPGQTITLQGFS